MRLLFDVHFILQESLGNMARNLRALVTKNSAKERFRTAQTYLQKIKFLVDDVRNDAMIDLIRFNLIFFFSF